MSACKICESNFSPFVDFGMMPIANSFSRAPQLAVPYQFSMQVGFCEACKMVQLVHQPDRELMFHENYAFHSSTSNYMDLHFRNMAKYFKSHLNLNNHSFIVEVGCNDGILLEKFKNFGIPGLGVEPSSNVALKARDLGLNVIDGFFDEQLSKSILHEYNQADLIVSANVMCHIPYIHSVFAGIKSLLKPGGVFVFEDPYLGDVIKKTAFDQIYDEHVFLFSAISVQNLALMHGMQLIDVEAQPTHGGSMRYSIGHVGTSIVSKRVEKIIRNEINLGLDKIETFQRFQLNIDEMKNKLISILQDLKNNGKKVVGYGATSKSTTVINYFNITSDLVSCIYDTTPAKYNTFSPGAEIPVLPYDGFRDSNPDYVLLFAWNHMDEIFEKEKNYMTDGKSWITYLPQLRIVTP